VPPTDLKAKKAEFTRLWTEAYRAKLGYAYHFTQRDTKALNELLPSVEDIAALADEFRGAWQLTGPRHWHCERAITVHYFAGHLNEIRREMKKTGTEGERKF
jgi:hypothetical protein